MRIFLLVYLQLCILMAAFSQETSWSDYSYSTSTSNKAYRDVAFTSKNEMIAIGSFVGSLTIQGVTLVSNGLRDFFISKYDVNGNLLWARSYGGVEFESATSIAITGNDELLISLSVYSSFHFGTTFIDYDLGGSVLFKLDVNGDLIWYRQGGKGASASHFRQVILDSEENIILTGSYYFGEAEYFGHQLLDLPWASGVFIIKLDSEGELLWYQNGAQYRIDDGISDIELDADDNIIASGTCFSYISLGEHVVSGSNEGYQFFFRIDKDGESLSVITSGKDIHNRNASWNSMSELVIDKEGHYYVTGRFQYNLTFFGHEVAEDDHHYQGYIAKVDTTGHLIWFKHFPRRNISFGEMILTADDHLLVTGTYRDSLATNDFKIKEQQAQSFLLELDLDGNTINGFSSRGYNSFGSQLAYDKEKSLYLSGTFHQDFIWNCDSVYGSGSSLYTLKFGERNDSLSWDLESEDAICLNEDSTFTVSVNIEGRFRSYTLQFPEEVDSVSMHLDGNEFVHQFKYLETVDSAKIVLEMQEVCGVIIEAPPIYKRLIPEPEMPRHITVEPFYCDTDTLHIELHPQQYAAAYEWGPKTGLTQLNDADTTVLPVNRFAFAERSREAIVSVKAKNQCGVSEEHIIHLDSILFRPVIYGEIDGDAEICVGEASTYSVQSDGGNLRYVWRSNTYEIDTLSRAGNIYFLPKQPGDVEITVYNFNECGANLAAQKQIKVLDVPEKPLLSINECHTELATDSVSDARLIWEYKGEEIARDQTLLQGLSKGLYLVRTTNVCGTSNSEPVEVFPPIAEDTFIPNVITPNEDKKNDTWVLGDALLDSKFRLYNRYGKLVYSDPNYRNDFRGTKLPVGTYFYYLENKCFQAPLKGSLSILR